MLAVYYTNMDPKLVSIAGPLKGAIFTLTEEEISIGREVSNRLCISDPWISRRHCLVRKEAGQFQIRDLDSLNGTFVNGVPVKERLLEHGDHIKVGDSLFLFLLQEGETPPTSSPVQLEEGRLAAQSTVVLRNEDAFYLQPERVLEALPPTARMARDLNALLKISTAINSIQDSGALQRQLLELIFEVVPAERGAILLAGRSPEEFASVFGLERVPKPGRAVQVSRTVVQRVLGEGVAILSNDILENEALGASKSLIGSRICSLLCVPLSVFKKRLGVIYLDTADPTVRFDNNHLQLLTAIAGIASVALKNTQHVEWLESENRRLQADLHIEHNMVGESPRMREVYQFIAKAAPSDSTVLIRGESGTGKELTARAVHMSSPRAGKPFVAINCAVLTETLLESELFGYEKGAFTGATAQKKGKLEEADGGTVFLDEVAELAPTLQAKLLRVLQEREFERVGGTRPIKVDIRLVAATNKDLEEAIRSGTFRQDLYYRLNVLSLTMPPLRERLEDIPLLASYFVAKYSGKCRRRVLGISAEARTRLIHYDWPGNVRELENAIERAVVLGSTDLILPEDLPEDVLETEPPMEAPITEHRPTEGLSKAVPETELPAEVPITKFYEGIKEAKKQLILKAVKRANGNYVEAAKLLGVHPNNLHRLIRNLNLKTAVKE